ncbi:MAG: class I SAM-dependent methyltransferase [Candidatus Hermodarchaeota archaeon]
MVPQLNEIIDYYSKECIQGYHTVLLISLGRRLGIFEYLSKLKEVDANNKESKIITFSPEAIAQELKLDPLFLDGWIHIALEFGIFSINKGKKGFLQTAPYIYELFLDNNSPFYLGNLYGWIYKTAVMQEIIFERFKTGQAIERLDGAIFEESSRDGQKLSTINNNTRLRLFSKNLKIHHQNLRDGGRILEIGCGIGTNLQIWANKYKNAKFIAIDPNPRAITILKEIIGSNNWEDRIEALNYSLKEFVGTDIDKRFDVIILNEVVHEIIGDDATRKKFINDTYGLLKDDGVLLIGEEIIPKTFDVEKGKTFWKSIKKWDEIIFGARFYNQEEFKKLILSTKFKHAIIFQEKTDCIWAISK